ncbi:MAG: HD domain-containing protein, partial [Chloroflexi bacterium]|nr:HD domain-containing protein [Chloroflexota bacterium]
EARDAFTVEHLRSVRKIAHRLAIGLGESEETAELIGKAAVAHDVGKIGIPDNVLGKPSELTRDEFNLVKTHTIIGEQILGDSPLFELERKAARHHHEWWNGEGYPDGISGEEIPLVARITAVADVFDALISKRPYKEPWPLDRAVDYLRERSGKHFDPAVVEVFLRQYLKGSIPIPPSVSATSEHAIPDRESVDAAPVLEDAVPAFLQKRALSDGPQRDNVDSASDTAGARQAGDDPIVTTYERAKEIHGQANRDSATETDESSQARGSGIVSTGDSLLDQKLGGGVPVGSLTLIDGESGAGKSILAQHFISGALKDGRRVVLYSNENSEKSLLSQMAGLGMHVAEFLTKRQLEVHEIPAGSTGGQAPVRLETLLRHMSQLEDWDLVVMDSLTGFLVSESDEDLLSFFTRCKQYHSQGKTVITIVHTNAISDSNLIAIVSICDVYLRLRIQVVGDKRVKIMEVAKVRGAKNATGGIVSFDVESGLGIVPVAVRTKVQG